MLKGFAKDGRDLTDKETKAFLKAADKDGDGKIGVDGELQPNLGFVFYSLGFAALVHTSASVQTYVERVEPDVRFLPYAAGTPVSIRFLLTNPVFPLSLSEFTALVKE